jgi:hypothetical protein
MRRSGRIQDLGILVITGIPPSQLEKVISASPVRPQRLKPALKNNPDIAALKRCATQNQVVP